MLKLINIFFLAIFFLSCDSSSDNTNDNHNIPLKVDYISPFSGETGVKKNLSIMIVFSEKTKMYVDHTIQFLTVRDAGSNIVSGSLDFYNAKCLIFKPDTDFKSDETYTIEINKNAIDIYNNSLEAVYTSTFTANNSSVIDPIIESLISVSLDKIIIGLDMDLDPRSLNLQNIIIKDRGGIIGKVDSFEYNYKAKQITIYLNDNLKPNYNNYYLFFPKDGLANLAGIKSVADDTLLFTTPAE
jgi:hypothetical protein